MFCHDSIWNDKRMSTFKLIQYAFCVSMTIFAGHALAGGGMTSKNTAQMPAQFSFDHTSIMNVETGDRITMDDAIGMLFDFPKGVTTKLLYPDEANLVVSDANGILFELPHGMSTAYINSIIIRSPNIKNADGIGVGTSVDNFLRTYPFAKLYYTKHDKKLWLSNGVGETAFQLTGKQLIKNLTSYLSNTRSNWINIDTGRLPKNATITAINISGRIFDYQNHLGQWESADKTVYLNMFEKDNQPYYQLSIGKRILNQYDGKLIAVLDTLYSEPAGNKYHLVLSPANGDAPDGRAEMTVTLTPHTSLPAESYVLKKREPLKK